MSLFALAGLAVDIAATPHTLRTFSAGAWVEGEWITGEPARAGRSWPSMLGNGALVVGCFWIAAKLLT